MGADSRACKAFTAQFVSIAPSTAPEPRAPQVRDHRATDTAPCLDTVPGMNPHYNDAQVNEYAKSRNIAPGTLLWASDVPLTEDAFRAGAKNNAAADYLRFSDLRTDTERSG